MILGGHLFRGDLHVSVCCGTKAKVPGLWAQLHLERTQVCFENAV